MGGRSHPGGLVSNCEGCQTQMHNIMGPLPGILRLKTRGRGFGMGAALGEADPHHGKVLLSLNPPSIALTLSYAIEEFHGGDKQRLFISRYK